MRGVVQAGGAMVDVDRQPAARRAAAPSTRPLNDHIPRSASPDLPRQKHRSRRQTASLPRARQQRKQSSLPTLAPCPSRSRPLLPLSARAGGASCLQVGELTPPSVPLALPQHRHPPLHIAVSLFPAVRGWRAFAGLAGLGRELWPVAAVRRQRPRPLDPRRRRPEYERQVQRCVPFASNASWASPLVC
jgi:hypothetical protein